MRYSVNKGGPGRFGRSALMAGASEGIGAAFARALAARGFDLVLVARRASPLTALSEEIARTHGVAVAPLALDLGDTSGIDRLFDACAGREVGLVISNAAAAPRRDSPRPASPRKAWSA